MANHFSSIAFNDEIEMRKKLVYLFIGAFVFFAGIQVFWIFGHGDGYLISSMLSFGYFVKASNAIPEIE